MLNASSIHATDNLASNSVALQQLVGFYDLFPRKDLVDIDLKFLILEIGKRMFHKIVPEFLLKLQISASQS